MARILPGQIMPRQAHDASGRIRDIAYFVPRLVGTDEEKKKAADAIKAKESNAVSRSPYESWATINISGGYMAFLTDDRLSNADKTIMSMCVANIGIGNEVTATQKAIATGSKCSTNTVSTSIKKLVEYGYLVRGPDKILKVSKEVAYRGSWNKF